MAKKNPSTVVFWDDLDTDIGLKLCSLAAQGLWLRMLCIAARSDPQGYVAVDGVPCTPDDLAALVGQEVGKIIPLLEELGSRKVYSKTTDGVMYNRRMVRDTKRSETNRILGSKGGQSTYRNKTGIFQSLGNSAKHDAEPDAKRAPERASKLFYTSSLQESESSHLPSESPTRARDPETRAKVLATRFVDLRAELWPHDDPTRLVMLTLWTEAQTYLRTLPLQDCERIVERVMRKNAADGKSAPRSLGFCRLSMQDAAAGQQVAEKTAAAPSDGLVRALEGQALRDQLRRKGYAEKGIWYSEWGDPPADIAPPAKAKRRAAATPAPEFPS